MSKFASVYNCFLDNITDDMYVELTPQDTLKDLQNLLIRALPDFEFPRINLYDYTIATEIVANDEISEEDFVIEADVDDGYSLIDNSYFAADLTLEEENILAYAMLDGWYQRQISSIENTRMKYSGSDYSFTSQANHLSKLLNAQEKANTRCFHMQRLYKRRKQDDDGVYQSTWSVLRTSALDGQ